MKTGCKLCLTCITYKIAPHLTRFFAWTFLVPQCLASPVNKHYCTTPQSYRIFDMSQTVTHLANKSSKKSLLLRWLKFTHLLENSLDDDTRTSLCKTCVLNPTFYEQNWLLMAANDENVFYLLLYVENCKHCRSSLLIFSWREIWAIQELNKFVQTCFLHN